MTSQRQKSCLIVNGLHLKFRPLKGAPVRALDLRAGAAMVIAGLVAEGTTQVEDVVYIERGYENIVDKLVDLGADIYRRRDGKDEAPANVG